MIGSTIIAVTLVPVLCTFLIRGRLHREEDNPVMRLLRAIYAPALRFALGHRVLTLVCAAGLFAFSLYIATTIGSEFMPPLDEETAMWMPVTDPSISLSKASELMREQDRKHAREVVALCRRMSRDAQRMRTRARGAKERASMNVLKAEPISPIYQWSE